MSTGSSPFHTDGVEMKENKSSDYNNNVKNPSQELSKKFWRRGTMIDHKTFKNHDDAMKRQEYIKYTELPCVGKYEYAPGLTEGEGWGIYGYKSKLLTFNGAAVRHYLAPFLTPELTVCNYWYVWLQHTMYNVYAITLMCILALGSNAFPDGEFGSQEKVCEDEFGNSINKKICMLEVVLDEARSEFRFLIAFVLAGYVANAVNTWNTRRKLYGTVCGKSRALIILLSAALPLPKEPNDPKDETLELRQTMNRWVILALELATLKAQGLMDTEDAREYLEQKSLVKGDEWETMVAGDRHTSVFFWIATKVNKLDASMIDRHLNDNVIEGIIDMRGAANDMMDCICTDHPFPYVALCGLLVKLNVLLMSTWQGVRWSIWYRSFGQELWSQPKIWVDLFALFTWNISYVCLYDLGYVLYNPFKDRRIDLAHEAIVAGLHNLGTELAQGSRKCLPGTMTF